jgi:PAS domain S-box-containing protein
MKPIWLDRAPLPTGAIRAERVVYANQALVDLMGAARAEIEGRHFTDFIAPEDRARVGERQALRLRGEPVPESYEFHVLLAGGARRLVEVWVTVADGDVVFQLHDRTHRALRQEKLGELARLGVAVAAEPTEVAVFTALSSGLTALGMAMARLAPAPGAADPAMRIVALTAPGDLVERFRVASGLGAAEVLGDVGPGAGLAWREGSAYLDDMPQAAARFLRGDPAQAAGAALTREAMLARGVLLRIDLGGAPSELLVLMAEWLLPEHLPACRLFGAQISAALGAARAQAQLVERERLAAIGELAAVVAHEVRNPLGVLFNSLGTFRKLLGEGVDGAARTLVEIMEEEAARLNHIVRDLLDFARPTLPTLQRERLDQVLEEAVDAALGESRDRVGVTRQIDDLPPVPMDARLIRQALLNIAVNAVQAMPRGGTITLRLSRDPLDDGRPAARIEIEDTGAGIAPGVEPRIFEPFFTTRATGTGLGLAVVKRIVDSHQGRLRVSSIEGEGTTFTLWLPLE